MRKVSFLGTGLLGITVATWAAVGGGDEVGNGDNLAEQQVVFAHTHLEKYIEICLSVASCGITEEERTLLQRITAALPEERRLGGLPRFVSAHERPGFFTIGGEVKTAKTGNAIGTPIYVNSDLLQVSSGSDDRVVSLGIPFAVALLVHEFGHHHGERDEAHLDRLASKVRFQALARTNYAPNMYSPDLSVEILVQSGDMILSDSQALFDVTPKIKRFYCPDREAIPFLVVGNARWHSSATVESQIPAHEWTFRYTVVFGTKYRCSNDDQLVNAAESRITFLARESKDLGWKPRIVPGSIEVR